MKPYALGDRVYVVTGGRPRLAAGCIISDDHPIFWSETPHFQEETVHILKDHGGVCSFLDTTACERVFSTAGIADDSPFSISSLLRLSHALHFSLTRSPKKGHLLLSCGTDRRRILRGTHPFQCKVVRLALAITHYNRAYDAWLVGPERVLLVGRYAGLAGYDVDVLDYDALSPADLKLIHTGSSTHYAARFFSLQPYECKKLFWKISPHIAWEQANAFCREQGYNVVQRIECL